jgi:hypothetical protein
MFCRALVGRREKEVLCRNVLRPTLGSPWMKTAIQYMRARSVRYQVLVPVPGTITRGPFYCNTRHKGLSHIRTCTTQRSTILKNEQMTTGLFVVQLITMLFSNLTASKVNSSVDNPQPHPKFFK